MSEKIADELHAFIAAAPHKYPGHLIELFDRAEKALRRCSADSADLQKRLQTVVGLLGDVPDKWQVVLEMDGERVAWLQAGDFRKIAGGTRAEPQTAPMPQNVEVAIKRMKTLADTALPGRTYEEECQAQMRNACVLLEIAYRSQAESAQKGSK